MIYLFIFLGVFLTQWIIGARIVYVRVITQTIDKTRNSYSRELSFKDVLESAFLGILIGSLFGWIVIINLIYSKYFTKITSTFAHNIQMKYERKIKEKG